MANFKILRAHVILTHCGLVTPYGNIDLGQHWHALLPEPMLAYRQNDLWHSPESNITYAVIWHVTPIYHYWTSIMVPYLWVTATHLQYINMGIEMIYRIYLTQIHPCLQSYISSTQFPAGFQPMWSNLLAELVAHKVLIEPNTRLYHSPILASLLLHCHTVGSHKPCSW